MKLTEEQIQQEVKRKIPKKLAGGKYYAVWNEKQGDVTKAYIYYRDKSKLFRRAAGRNLQRWVLWCQRYNDGGGHSNKKRSHECNRQENI